jgi:nucleotide-binding universal stress UspA family protein
MYRKILVPLDGSDFAERAVPMALAIAERTGGDLQLATAIPTLPPVVPAPDKEGPVKGWFEEERVRAGEYLEKTASRIGGGTEAKIHTKVLSGDPASAVEERVRKTGAELVVMTTHGRGPFERVWLGSVADGLIRRAPCPVLLWRAGEDDGEKVDLEARPRFRRILVPLDGSPDSESILPEAVAMARLFDARLSLVTIVPDPFPLGSTYIPHAARENVEREEVIVEARSYLEHAASGARDEGVETDFEVVVQDDAGSGVLAYREEIGADLVAMSTRGRGGVARLVLGSVADKIIRGGRVPVLVHRMTGEGEAAAD